MKKNIISTDVISIVNAILLCFTMNSFCLIIKASWLVPIVVVLFVIGNIIPLYPRTELPNIRFKICAHGNRCLKLFIVTMIFSAIFMIIMAFILIPDKWNIWLGNLLQVVVCETILFWNGMLSVYCTSTQLGLTTRFFGLIFGMVHGVFFRDSVKFNYWGRVPGELELNGASIFYGEHQSALLVEDSARELAERIKTIVETTGCEKLNVIAHSKGGVDTRFAIYKYGLENYVASLTTINSPHRGCEFSDYVVDGMPEKIKNGVANTYNRTLKKLGDENPDFLAAVGDLSSVRCKPLDEMMGVPDGVFCQSYGSIINHAIGGQFPLNFSYNLVKKFDGPNDGLVGINSFNWGEKFELVTNEGIRGISHGDMIDLNRKDIPGFDVREFYVQLVADLKQRGL